MKLGIQSSDPAPRSDAQFSLLFLPGRRPVARDVERLARSLAKSADRKPGFAISYRPDPADWLELLFSGMPFDLVGLASSAAVPMPAIVHSEGYPDVAATSLAIYRSVEAITLIPGDTLQNLHNQLPVVRAMTGLAAQLTELAGTMGVVWHPARCAMAPTAFVAAHSRWRAGGALPVPGLVALLREQDDTLRTEGLAFFIGQELRMDPIIGKYAGYDVHIVTDLVNQLVGCGSVQLPFETTGPSGEQLSVVPSGSDGFLRVWRRT